MRGGCHRDQKQEIMQVGMALYKNACTVVCINNVALTGILVLGTTERPLAHCGALYCSGCPYPDILEGGGAAIMSCTCALLSLAHARKYRINKRCGVKQC